MRVKQEFMDDKTELMKLGFEYKEIINTWGDECYETEGNLVYNLGHSRRGQWYYYIINEDTRELSVFATKPDGDGTDVLLDEVVITMYDLGMFEVE